MTICDYRLLQIKDGDGEGVDCLFLAEVYYDEDGNPQSYNSRPPSVMGLDLTEVQKILTRMEEAISRDVIPVENFPLIPIIEATLFKEE